MQLRILVVDDDSVKTDRMVRAIHDRWLSEVYLQSVKCIAQGRKALQLAQWDVLLLDLLIPIRNGETPNRDGGRLFLAEMHRQGFNATHPCYLIGITSVDELSKSQSEYFRNEGVVVVEYRPDTTDWETPVHSIVARAISARTVRRGVLIPLHGIRTRAEWQRQLFHVAQRENWTCPIHRWNYGRFSLLQFLWPWSRAKKFAWFRSMFSEDIEDVSAICGSNRRPSVVAHSFGSLILGSSLLKYNDIAVDKVILCGSLLPLDFPWRELIDSGRVGEVCNIVGGQDRWPRICSYVIPGTGPSGCDGFIHTGVDIRNVRHDLNHTEFFDFRQMQTVWFPFLNRVPFDVEDGVEKLPNHEVEIQKPQGSHPWLSSILQFVVLFVLILLGLVLVYCVSVCVVHIVDFAVDVCVGDNASCATDFQQSDFLPADIPYDSAARSSSTSTSPRT